MPTILLVEDDPNISQVIANHLTETGFSVIAEPSTSAALDKIGSEQKIDLLLVDLVMPPDQPDGLAFATKFKAKVPDVPVIFMTGYYGFVAETGLQPRDLAKKPLDLDRLTREINTRLSA